MVMTVLEWLVAALGLAMAGGTLLSFSNREHWFIRGWDFPRAQIALFLLLSGVSYALFFFDDGWFDWLFLSAVTAALAWQLYKILPYTPFWPRSVQGARRDAAAESGPGDEPSLRLVISNVEMENRRFDRWREVVSRESPDVVIAAEVDGRWLQEIEPLRERFPHVVAQPQDNYFGMVLLSRLPLIDPTVEFLVQDSVPSIHTLVELKTGQRVSVHALHPRPPEPKRSQDAAPRDAELVVVARRVRRYPDRPTIVAGDLNDVAWSRTTELFRHVSGLLDPRRGRGLFNSFSARSRFWRFPLDHVFTSNHFRLVEIRLLDEVGSDHFPVLVELRLEHDAPQEQPEPAETGSDAQLANEKLQEQAERENSGGEK